MNLLCFALMWVRYHVALEIIQAEALPQDLVAALIVGLMAIGLEIVKLVIGRTNVIAVDKEVI